MTKRSMTVIRFTEEELLNLLSDTSSQVHLKENVDYEIALTPICLRNPEAAIYAILDRDLMKYFSKYKGIVLSYKNVRARKNTGIIEGDNAHIFIDLIVDVYIFAPTVGCILKGLVSKKSPDGIGCLVHKGFNVAIPRPWSEANDQWPGNEVKIGEEVILQVEILNFCGRLPYIRGKLVTGDNLTKRKRKKSKTSFNIDNGESSETVSGISTEIENTSELLRQEKSNEFSTPTNQLGLSSKENKKKKRRKDKLESEISLDASNFVLPIADEVAHTHKEKKKHKSKDKLRTEQNELEKTGNEGLDEPQFVQSLTTASNFVSSRDDQSEIDMLNLSFKDMVCDNTVAALKKKNHKKESKHKPVKSTLGVIMSSDNNYERFSESSPSGSKQVLPSDLYRPVIANGIGIQQNKHINSSKKRKKIKERNSDSESLLLEQSDSHKLMDTPFISSHEASQSIHRNYVTGNKLLGNERKAISDSDVIEVNCHSPKKRKKDKSNRDYNVDERIESQKLVETILSTKMMTFVDNADYTSNLTCAPQQKKRKRKHSDKS